MSQIESSYQQEISEQTFLDLCTWLSDDLLYSEDQLTRLLEEEHYLKLIELANTYWLIGHLTTQIKKKHIWQRLPQALKAYLTTLEKVYQQRSQAIQQEVISVCRVLKKVTPQLVLLKGSAALFNGVANPISTRYMADIDILVAQDKLNLCLEALSQNGYILDVTDASISTKDFHHASPLIRQDGPCYIEIHRRPLVNTLKNILSAEEAMNQSMPLLIGEDLIVQQMHPTQQIIHTIAHSELQDRGYKEAHIDLRQLLNFYLIAKTFAVQICWRTVEQRFTDTKQFYVLEAIVFHANKLFGLPIFIDHFEQGKSKIQYQKCIRNFTQEKHATTLISSIRKVLQGYSKATIINLYGEKGYFPVFRGRLKHVKRHLLLLFRGD